MNDWSESYIKLEQLLKASRDAFNQERYDDALSLALSIEAEAQKLQNFASHAKQRETNRNALCT